MGGDDRQPMGQELCGSVWPQRGNDRAGDKKKSLPILSLDVQEPLTPFLLQFPTPHSL